MPDFCGVFSASFSKLPQSCQSCKVNLLTLHTAFDVNPTLVDVLRGSARAQRSPQDLWADLRRADNNEVYLTIDEQRNQCRCISASSALNDSQGYADAEDAERRRNRREDIKPSVTGVG